MSDTPANPDAALSMLAPTPKTVRKYICPKHGEVTTQVLSLTLHPRIEAEQPQLFVYCIHCLNDVLLTFQKNKAIETLQVVDELV